MLYEEQWCDTGKVRIIGDIEVRSTAVNARAESNVYSEFQSKIFHAYFDIKILRYDRLVFALLFGSCTLMHAQNCVMKRYILETVLIKTTGYTNIRK